MLASSLGVVGPVWAQSGDVDLAVVSVSVSDPIYRGEVTDVVAVIENLGTRDAVGFSVAAILDTTMVATTATMTLAAGTSTTVTIAAPVPLNLPLGGVAVGVYADSTSVVEESRETNNIRGRQVQVREGGVDLVGQFILMPQSGRPGDPIQLEILDENRGPRPAGPHRTHVLLVPPGGGPPALVGTFSMPDIAPGASHRERTTFTVPALPAGRYVWLLQVDGLGDVAEVDETNNEQLGATMRVLDGPLQILTFALETAWVGQPYTDRLLASTPVTWSLGMPLPPGLTLESATGIISGVPQVPGTAQLLVRASNGGESAEAFLELVVRPDAFAIDAITLPYATVGRPYSFALTAHGGTPPYTFFSPGVPEVGITVDDRGVVGGTPTRAGVSRMEVRAIDAYGQGARTVLELITLDQPAPLVIQTTELPTGRVDEAYCAGGTVRLVALGGTAPLRWSLEGDGLPRGLLFNELGHICGTPQEAGEHALVFRVRDTEGQSAAQSVRLVIEPAGAPPMPSPSNPPLGLETAEPTGCGCTTAGAPDAAWAALLLALTAARRHRRRPSS